MNKYDIISFMAVEKTIKMKPYILVINRRKTMTYYYHLDSDGEDTNLQLHAYRHAKDLWQDLKKEYDDLGENTEKLKEKCVLVLATLGLSISQLLGQNNPTLGNKVPYPIDIFIDFVDTHKLNHNLKKRFKKFNYFYNGCRHFGKTTGGGNGYKCIDELTFKIALECYNFGLEVWQTIINTYRGENGSDLDELEEVNNC